MRPQSNINVTLRKKRRLSRMKKIAYSAVFILFFISLCILGLTSNKVRIQNITVSGNMAVSNNQILNIVNPILDEKHLLIIPTDNFFLLKRNEIKMDILENIKTINAVKISFQNLNKINIVVSERVAENLWCQGDPSKIGNCFLMDQTGFVFASSTASSSLSEYFGFFTDTNPIGESYFDSAQFADIQNLMGALNQMGFVPQYFNAADEHTYQVYLKNGGKILLNDEKTFTQSLINLEALVSNGFIKMDEKSLTKINYIDLQSGNKVFCSPASICKQGN